MSFVQYVTERKIAGIFAGIGSLALLAVGETALSAVILSGLLGFFVGETNGSKRLMRSTTNHDADSLPSIDHD